MVWLSSGYSFVFVPVVLWRELSSLIREDVSSDPREPVLTGFDLCGWMVGCWQYFCCTSEKKKQKEGKRKKGRFPMRDGNKKRKRREVGDESQIMI